MRMITEIWGEDRRLHLGRNSNLSVWKRNQGKSNHETRRRIRTTEGGKEENQDGGGG